MKDAEKGPNATSVKGAEKGSNATSATGVKNAPNATSTNGAKKASPPAKDTGILVQRIMKYTAKGIPIHKICQKTGADRDFVEDVVRIYLTHPGVTLRGILDRLEIKGR